MNNDVDMNRRIAKGNSEFESRCGSESVSDDPQILMCTNLLYWNNSALPSYSTLQYVYEFSKVLSSASITAWYLPDSLIQQPSNSSAPVPLPLDYYCPGFLHFILRNRRCVSFLPITFFFMSCNHPAPFLYLIFAPDATGRTWIFFLIWFQISSVHSPFIY